MNILILSCGTRYKLVEYFKEREVYDKVVVTDCSENAPALYIADKFYLVPQMKEPGYLECIFDICVEESINLVLPLQEDELLLIARSKQLFLDAQIVPIISDYEKVLLCKDKLLLNKWLEERRISAVPTVLAKEYLEKDSRDGEIFVKPRFGAGSVNTLKVRSRRLLDALVEETTEELIVQPCIKGKEYGVDVYVDMISNEVIVCFCKQKLRMRAGETEKSVSIINTEIEELVSKAVTSIGLVGPLDVDVMEQEGKYYILEINPRFGGGYLHAHVCGISFPELIAKNGAGRKNRIKENYYLEYSVAMKYSDIIVRQTI